jgi:hypothetical protein
MEDSLKRSVDEQKLLIIARKLDAIKQQKRENKYVGFKVGRFSLVVREGQIHGRE